MGDARPGLYAHFFELGPLPLLPEAKTHAILLWHILFFFGKLDLKISIKAPQIGVEGPTSVA